MVSLRCCSLIEFQTMPTGEQHGFRKAKNIQTSLDGELYFFSRVLKPTFEPHLSADFEPFEILNL